MRPILEELGEGGDEDELDELRDRVARAEMPTEAEKVARKQISRLRSIQPQSAEYNVAHTYVEWLADLPWDRSTPDQIDVKRVAQCLDEDHYGLERVKRRIVEYAAVRQLRDDKKGPILLFVGPPGVGKTSLGRSIARAMGRRYRRIALGGVRDEAEIRGHRRTYVGALPGRIIQSLKKVGTRNPVFVLDEVDKMGSDERGDPSSALLEVLDPEQNDTFIDHYIEMPFDLSQITFLATANERHKIPGPLRDRMEIIDVPGYTRSEKLNIAMQFLVPKQLRENGVSEPQLEFTEVGVSTIIDHFTHESGVRGLEREIGAICRDIAVRMAEGERPTGLKATPEHIDDVLGTRRFHPELAERSLRPGVAMGLGVSGAGGDVVFIEATRMPGKGKILVTGSLQDIMKESAAAAVSTVRSGASKLGLDPKWLKDIDLHLHVPRGGSIRDGASFGIPMFVATSSLMLGIPTLPGVAMAGELTLRGNVLRVTNVKDRVLAAHRAGVRTLLLPEQNRRDLEAVPREILSLLEIRFISKVDEVLAMTLDPSRAPAPALASEAVIPAL